QQSPGLPAPRAHGPWLLAAAMVLVCASLSSWAILRIKRAESPTPNRDSQELALEQSRLLDAQAKLAVEERNRVAVFRLDESRRGESAAAIVVPSGATELTLVVPRDIGLPNPVSATLYQENARSRTPV